jgi:Fic family protein
MSYQPEYTITPVLLDRVEQIAALRERIMAATVQVRWIPALQKDTRPRNTHSSTAIEGNPLTLEQVRALEEGREVPAVAPRAKREVANYFAGLRFIEENATKATIKHEDVLQLHKIMAGDVMDQGAAGCYRTIAVGVGIQRGRTACDAGARLVAGAKALGTGGWRETGPAAEAGTIIAVASRTEGHDAA